MEPQAVPTSDVVTVRVADHLATITIDNPPVNTITKALRTGLARALDQLEHATDVRGVLLHCAGSTFCSGADIGEFDGPPLEAEYRTLFARLEALPVPVVVALHGTVLGAAWSLPCAATIAWPTPGRAWASRKSRLASFRAPPAPSGCRG